MRAYREYGLLFRKYKEKGPDAPFTIIYGPENYLKKVAVDRLTTFLDNNKTVFFGRDANTDDILASLSAGGLFVKKKLVVIYNFEKLKQKERIFSQHITDGVFVAGLISEDAKFSTISSLKKKFGSDKNIIFLEFNAFDETSFQAWVKNRLNTAKIRYDEQTFKQLIKKLPRDTTQAVSELEKLFTYAGEEKLLEPEHIAIIFGRETESVVKTLSAMKGNEQMTISRIFKVMEETMPNNLLYETETYFLNVLSKINEMVIKPSYVPSYLKPYYNTADKYFTEKDIAIILKRLAHIEYILKTGISNATLIKDRIILSLLP